MWCHLALIVCILSFSLSLNAGDVKIGAYYVEQFAEVNQPQTAELDFTNDEAYDVNDFKVNYSVYKLTGYLTWELEYEYEKNNMTVPANSSVTVNNSDMPWTPSLLGRYQWRITTTASNDINPDNDDINIDVSVNRFKRLGFKQFNMVSPDFGMKSDWGWVSFKISPKTDFTYYNLKARNPDTQEESWIVKNAEIPPLTDEYFTRISGRFKYSDFGFTAGIKVESVDFIVQETDEPINQFQLDYGWMNVPVRLGDIKLGIRHDFKKKGAAVAPVKGVNVAESVQEFNYVSYINDLMSDDLNNTTNPPTAEYAGDLGASGPHAAAMGFHLLDKGWDEITIEADTSVRMTLEALSGMMARSDTGTTTTRQVISAKLQYIDQKMIPVGVNFQSMGIDDDIISSPVVDYGHRAVNNQAGNNGIPPTWYYIYNSMMAGCAVEIQIGWYDDQGNQLGGFWVPVVGVSQSDSTRSITIKEDANEADSARSISNTFHHFQEDNGWGWLESFDHTPWKAYIESVIVQCYDPTVTFDPISVPEYKNHGNHNLVIYDNPGQSSEEVNVSFSIDQPGDVEIMVYSLHGKLIGKEMLGNRHTGEHYYTLPAELFQSSGNYLIVFNTRNEISVGKVIRY